MTPFLRATLVSLAVGTLGVAVGGWRIGLQRRRAARQERLRRAAEAEEYLARQLIQRTLDARADLRRRAPHSPEAARRYAELLALELAGLEELEHGLRDGVRDEDEAAAVIAEAEAELRQLRTEIAWCRTLLGGGPQVPRSA